MKAQALMFSLMLASPVFAANFGSTEPPKTTTTPPSTTTVAPPKPASTPAATGPQVTGLFRIVKPDGATVIAQTAIGSGSNVINVINVATSDAFLTSGGKCAFNVKYDEVSGVAASSTTNRLFSNDALIAQNTKIDLAPNVLKTIWTQPYLVPGQNNVKIVVNADSATPSVGWVRVNVSGTCGASQAPATTPPATTPPKTEPPKLEPPKTTPPVVTPPPMVKFAPRHGRVEQPVQRLWLQQLWRHPAQGQELCALQRTGQAQCRHHGRGQHQGGGPADLQRADVSLEQLRDGPGLPGRDEGHHTVD